MSAMSNYLETQILNHVFRNTAMAAPTANVYVSLHTADPTDAGTGTEVSTTSTGYARATLATASSFSAPVDDGSGAMVVQNSGAISFSPPTAAWGTVTHFGIWDTAAGGNLLVYGPLSTAKAITAGDTVQFAIGDLKIKMA